MAVEKCIYDNLGRCVRTATNVWRDPAPPGFEMGHFATMYLVAIVVGLILLPRFRSFWGMTNSPAGKAATAVFYVFLLYGSMCLTVFGWNHSFRLSQLSSSIDETNRYLGMGSNWLAGAVRWWQGI